MSLGEAIGSALANLASHKLRSALTMLGMIFGVGAVIAMLSIGAGAELQAMELIDRMGLRNVLVRDNGLADDDLNEIRRKSLGVSMHDASAVAHVRVHGGDALRDGLHTHLQDVHHHRGVDAQQDDQRHQGAHGGDLPPVADVFQVRPAIVAGPKERALQRPKEVPRRQQNPALCR